jgi:polyhydroxybutyrate depolymerase
MRPLPAIAGLLALLVLGCAAGRSAELTLQVDGQRRSYVQHLGPQSAKLRPLLLVFHGGGGNGTRAQQAFGYDAIADRNNLVVAYPSAIDQHWNDGRNSTLFAEHDKTVDDVAFITALVAELQAKHNTDPKRVYAVGMSNGGMFVQRLAIETPGLFTAVASIIASIPEPLDQNFAPKSSPSVLFMNGTADPIVPYEGGGIALKSLTKPGALPDRGRVQGTPESVQAWVKHLGLRKPTSVKKLPDLNPDDQSTVKKTVWGKAAGPQVVLYTVKGGGHTLPGGNSFLPARIVGSTNGDIQAAEEIWAFLKTKHK